MERNIAERLMENLLALSEPINSATLLTMRMSDTTEQKDFRKGIAAVMSAVYDLMMLIIREYPDLDPDK